MGILRYLGFMEGYNVRILFEYLDDAIVRLMDIKRGKYICAEFTAVIWRYTEKNIGGRVSEKLLAPPLLFTPPRNFFHPILNYSLYNDLSLDDRIVYIIFELFVEKLWFNVF